MPSKIAIKIVAKNEGKMWWWVAIAANGEILCNSEMYSSKKKREKTARAMAVQLGVKYVEA